jgi:mono/diheme cytochrome c family protein
MSSSQLRPHTSWRFGFAGVAVLIATGCSPEKPAAEPVQAAASQPLDPAVYRGSAFARQVCVQCHDVGAGGGPAVNNVGAPAFATIASRDGMTANHIVEWMVSSHPTMPTYMLNEAAITDIAAYIMSLRSPG